MYLNRLNTEDCHTREITLGKIKTYIRRSKKKVPGSNLNFQLKKGTYKTLEQLKNIFSACLSIGYFPSVSKEARVKFIPPKR